MINTNLILLDSITDVDRSAVGQVVVCGSHGGIYPAYLASVAQLKAVIFNDAGIGLEGAGIAGVMALTESGVAAATVSHESCRIGDAADMLKRGRISAVNELANRLGVACGDKTSDVCKRLEMADFSSMEMTSVKEARYIETLESTGKDVILLDSASLVTSDDVGQIVITGSHGGLIGGDPVRALKADAAFAVFNDAGIGCDNAGLTRLAALDTRGVAAATVAHSSARIGDALSILKTGRISKLNMHAKALKIELGELLVQALSKI